MLRYVSRRIKDTVERTSNVLEARRIFGNEGVSGYDGYDKNFNSHRPSPKHIKRFERHLVKPDSLNSVFEFGFEPKFRAGAGSKKCCVGALCNFQRKSADTADAKSSDSGSSSSGKEEHRERIRRKHHCKFQRSFIDALTWSGALICGWYTSQILCMKRRHLQNGWNGGRCKYAKVLMQPSQAFHSSIMSHWARAAPELKSDAYVWKYIDDDEKFLSNNRKFVELVSNDHLKNDVRAEPKSTAPLPKPSFDDAVNNLLHVLGDIEFHLGVASVESNRHDLAVSHFKLAASHSNASAAYNLGVCYEEGIGIQKNLKMALECYMLASSLGHAKALYNVGVFHARGLADLPKNRKAARQYFKEAAKLGLNEANRALGVREADRSVEMVGNFVAPKVTNYELQPVAVAV